MTDDEIEQADVIEQDYLWSNNGPAPFKKVVFERTEASSVVFYACPNCFTLKMGESE
jgi:hypothetical protein